MKRSEEKPGFKIINVWMQEGIVFIVCFFYLLLKVHPVLIPEARPPVFLLTTDFLNEFLKIPGGFSDWLTAFFMQFWFSDLWSALYIVLSLWLVAFLTRKWIEILTGQRPVHTYHLIPALLLLVLYTQYDFRPGIVTALIINLLFLILFIRKAPAQPVWRIILGLVTSALLYWITGGSFLIFAVLFGLYDILFTKKIVPGLLLILVSTFLPFITTGPVFLLPLKLAYLHNLISEYTTKFRFVGYSPYAYYLLALLFIFLAKYRSAQKQSLKKTDFLKTIKYNPVWNWVIGTVLLLVGTALLAQKMTDRTVRLVLQVNRLAKESHWAEILKSTRGYSSVNPLLSYQTNLALFHTNILLDSMFAYPQNSEIKGLLMDYEWSSPWPEEVSNLFWKLGLVSESQHWAHEALEQKGYTPALLKRLGLVYMLKGNHKAANRFLLNLKNVPFYNQIADQLIRINDTPSEMVHDDMMQSILAKMPVKDFISLGEPSFIHLEWLLKRNPKNKMAFEYLMAYHLLRGNLEEIRDNIPQFDLFDYPKLPRHITESLIFLVASNPKFDPAQLTQRILNSSELTRFVQYRQILQRYGGDKVRARGDLYSRFGDTYWYYLMYIKSPGQKTES